MKPTWKIVVDREQRLLKAWIADLRRHACEYARLARLAQGQVDVIRWTGACDALRTVANEYARALKKVTKRHNDLPTV
jgi:hypothetical protein